MEREALSLLHFLRDQSQPQSEWLNALSADQPLSEPVRVLTRQRALISCDFVIRFRQTFRSAAMIAKLSSDLLLELDRLGNRPLAVEDPRTHRRYWLVPDEPNARRKSAGNDDWSDAKNARRFELIDKEIAGTLTAAESSELTSLQTQMDDYLRRVAPLPIAQTRQLHARLVKLTRNKRS